MASRSAKRSTVRPRTRLMVRPSTQGGESGCGTGRLRPRTRDRAIVADRYGDARSSKPRGEALRASGVRTPEARKASPRGLDDLASPYRSATMARSLVRGRSLPVPHPDSPPWVDGLTISRVLGRTVERFADREAIVFPKIGYRRTWASLAREVDAVARGLIALGVRKGDHVAVWAT